jgi:hypothetical protein
VSRRACPRCHSTRIQLGYADAPLPVRLIGVRGLLCNNCNLEFRGMALFSKLKRERCGGEELGGNVRRAPRFRVRLPLTAARIETGHGSDEAWYSPPLRGHSHVISKVGLGLVLPSPHVGRYDFTDTGHTLWVRLTLPTGAVVMQASPVNHQALGGEGGNAGWLIGARIVKMGGGDRARYFQYLETLG